MKPSPTPPRWAEKFLSWFCKPELLEVIQGDLWESFENQAEHSPSKAKRRYIREVLGLFRPGIIRQFNWYPQFPITYSMLENYLKTAIRQIKRYKLFSGLNILGLASSMAICLLIILILSDQYGYDEFHANKENIFQIISGRGDKGTTFSPRNGTAPLPLAAELKEGYPGIKRALRIHAIRGVDVKYEEKVIAQKGLMVEPDFLKTFSFGWIEGNDSQALINPNSIIITQKLADQYYKEKSPLNQIITLAGMGDFVITGIIPNHPDRSHLQFDFLASFSTMEKFEQEGKWESKTIDWTDVYRNYVYVELDEPADKNYLEQALADIASRRNQKDQRFDYIFRSQSLLDIVPGDMNMGNDISIFIPKQPLYFLVILGFIIILSACFNYTNLSMARALKRSKEIGIRKVNGAGRIQIAAQFLVESILISWLSLLIAIFLLEFLIKAFHGLSTYIPQLFHLPQTPRIYFIFWIFSTVIGIIAGILPAIHLSSFQPVEIINKLSNLRLFSGAFLRKGLIIIQFSFSLIFIVLVLTILKQQKLLFETELGFKTKNIVNLELQGINYDIFSQRIKQIKGVESVSGSSIIPASGVNFGSMVIRPGAEEPIWVDHNHVSANFAQNLDIRLVSGETFPPNASKEQEQYIIINEAAVKRLGFSSPEAAIGESLNYKNGEFDSLWSANPLIIVGVMEDFYYHGLCVNYCDIHPYVFRYDPKQLGYANISIAGNDLPGAIEEIEKAWQEFDQLHPLRYTFYDQEIAQSYSYYTIGVKVMGLMGFLAVLIACMGLLGIVIYSIEGRVREVGIRKILGASEGSITWLLSRSFMILLGIAIVISTPLIWVINQSWLQAFNVRVGFIGEILLGILAILILGMFTVISQTRKAARNNPADSLRTE
ncbi:MAG: ABC transporter permease [Bacteroidetes bacterium]|nr:ABC transporter permease [Bacteroidota bacterium]